MSAETDLVHLNFRFGTPRRIARVSRGLVSEALEGAVASEDVYTVPPEQLMRLIGKASTGLQGEKIKGLYDFNNDLNKSKLTEKLEALAKRALSPDQKSILDLSVAPRFAEVKDINPELFTAAYGLYAGLYSSSPQAARNRWPIEEEYMFLGGRQTREIGPFMTFLATRSRKEQPYLSEFALGVGAGFFADKCDNLEPKDIFERADREAMIMAGIGLASFQLASQATDYAFEAIELAQSV